jgi:hypothetical protein
MKVTAMMMMPKEKMERNIGFLPLAPSVLPPRVVLCRAWSHAQCRKPSRARLSSKWSEKKNALVQESPWGYHGEIRGNVRAALCR